MEIENELHEKDVDLSDIKQLINHLDKTKVIKKKELAVAINMLLGTFSQKANPEHKAAFTPVEICELKKEIRKIIAKKQKVMLRAITACLTRNEIIAKLQSATKRNRMDFYITNNYDSRCYSVEIDSFTIQVFDNHVELHYPYNEGMAEYSFEKLNEAIQRIKQYWKLKNKNHGN